MPDEQADLRQDFIITDILPNLYVVGFLAVAAPSAIVRVQKISFLTQYGVFGELTTLANIGAAIAAIM